MKELKGMGVALVTPFDGNGNVDFDGLGKLINYQIENGCNYLVVMGTTGESATLNAQEKKEVLDFAIKTNNGKLPIVYGVGGNNTMAVCEQLRSMDTTGIDAILSVSPYYNKPTQEGIYQHYKAVSEASRLPIIVYNVPGRTSSNLTAATTLRLANDFGNIVAVKEASGNLEQVMTIIQNRPKDFLVISGDDAITLPMIAAGGDGVISVVGNAFPKDFSLMVSYALNNEIEKARTYHYKVYDIIDLLFCEGNPGGIKEACAEIGLMSNNLRLPLVNVSSSTANKIKELTRGIFRN
ncbi:MAG: 4-hydroxy-tetrahydrodipicolinate synthase [Crocinitomicaceae bacterium]|nr:4-hydroxy-tetrahydrodipicolinate synthase [Crocinitomicaceae bacterium]